MTQLYLNNARAVLVNPITASATTMTVAGVVGFPASLGAGEYFLLTLFLDTSRYGENIEVVKVTGLVDNQDTSWTLTVVRGVEMAAKSHSAGEVMQARLTAGTMAPLATAALDAAQPGVYRWSGGNSSLYAEELLIFEKEKGGSVTTTLFSELVPDYLDFLSRYDDIACSVLSTDGRLWFIIFDSGGATRTAVLYDFDQARMLWAKVFTSTVYVTDGYTNGACAPDQYLFLAIDPGPSEEAHIFDTNGLVESIPFSLNAGRPDGPIGFSGRYIALTDYDKNELYVYDREAGEWSTTIVSSIQAVHASVDPTATGFWVSGCSFNRDGSLLFLFGESDGTNRTLVVNTADWTLHTTLTSVANWGYQTSGHHYFNRDSTKVVYRVSSNNIVVADLATGNAVLTFDPSAAPETTITYLYTAIFGEDDDLWVVCDDNTFTQVIYVFDSTTGAFKAQLYNSSDYAGSNASGLGSLHFSGLWDTDAARHYQPSAHRHLSQDIRDVDVTEGVARVGTTLLEPTAQPARTKWHAVDGTFLAAATHGELGDIYTPVVGSYGVTDVVPQDALRTELNVASTCKGLAATTDRSLIFAGFIQNPREHFLDTTTTPWTVTQPTTSINTEIQAIAIAGNGSLAAVGAGAGDHINVFNPATGVEVAGVAPSGACYGLGFNSDGSYLVAGDIGETDDYVIYRTSDWVKIARSVSIAQFVYGVAFSPDDSLCALCHLNGDGLVILETATWGLASTPGITLPGGTVYEVAFSPDGSMLAAAAGSTVYLYNTTDWTRQTITGFSGSSGALNFSPDSSKLALGTSLGDRIYVYNTSDLSQVGGTMSAPGGVNAAVFVDNSTLLVGHSTSPYLTIVEDVPSIALPDLTADAPTAFEYRMKVK